jgi:hypothetical protein
MVVGEGAPARWQSNKAATVLLPDDAAALFTHERHG